jgi:hypothetical protein
VWVGVPIPGTELPERATVLRDALRDAGARIVPAVGHADDVLAFCYDTMTLVGPGTWVAARAAADAAQTARPPRGPGCVRRLLLPQQRGVAAATLRAAGADRVAVVDVDAHHGNGTQAIFYDRPDVFYGSAHVDPGQGWFPHYAGFADETGPGAGTTRNAPVASGVDAAADDPESPLRVTVDGYRRSAALVRDLGVPVVAAHEGGYHLPTLGRLTVATPEGVTGVTAPA